MTKRSTKRRNRSRNQGTTPTLRQLGHENLERRELLAAAVGSNVDVPGLVSIDQIIAPQAAQMHTAVDILEDSNGQTVPDVVADALPNAVTFEVLEAQSTIPEGLMDELPVVTPLGGITLFPSTDAVGTAVYVIRGTDADPVTPMSMDATLTINVRPVNDAPRFDESLVGTSDSASSDDAYSVGDQRDLNDNIIAAPITYTLPEDNTQPSGESQPFFIPINRDPSVVGYNRVGLLDVVTAGPENELDGTMGGSQVLELLNFPSATRFGGDLQPVFDSGVLVGLEYTPPEDLNSSFAEADSFVYEVRDDSTVGDETFSLLSGALIPNQLTIENTVFLNLNAINDRPEFTIAEPFIEIPEDANRLEINNFATSISPGPLNTAFDEVDVNNGQTVQFNITPLDFALSEADGFFTDFPAISAFGLLTFTPAPDVFGEFDFEVVLNDSGPNDPTRGDFSSSQPVTISIDVQPVNDSPVIADDAPELAFDLLEDGSVEILVRGDAVTPGLLNVFTPGPENESGAITPGGNQTFSLASPFPATSAEGGRLTQITDDNGQLLRFRYTPRPNFTGLDSFIYTVSDDGVTVDIGTGGAVREDNRVATSTVALNVFPVNDAPQFSGAANVVSDEDQGLVSIPNWATNVQAGPAGANDEAASQNLSFEIMQISDDTGLFATPPMAVIDEGVATLSYQTAPNANGDATFVVQLRDDGPTDLSIGESNLSEPQTFTIRVNAINDPPTFVSGGVVTVDEDSAPYNQPWAEDVSPGPLDEAAQSIRFALSVPTEAQELFLSQPEISDDGNLRFTPAPNQNGTADISVRAIDSEGGETIVVTLQIVINEVNDPPIPVSDTIDTNEDAVIVIPASQLLDNDIDPDLATNPNEVLTVLMPADSLSVSGARITYDEATGQIVYDPTLSTPLQSLAPGESVVDSFAYSIRDTAGVVSTPVTVALNVEGVNDAPTLVNDLPTLALQGPTVIPVLDNDTDVDGSINPLTIMITLQPAFGSLDIDPDGVITYTPFGSFSQVDQFRYTVADNLGDRSEEALVTISANAAPVARDDAGLSFLDEAVDIPVAANDEDTDGQLDVTSIMVVTPPLGGEVIPLADGSVRYVPNPGFLGDDSFEYTIADSDERRSEPAEVTLRVVGSRLQNPNPATQVLDAGTVINPDVNEDSNVTAIDALLIINRLSLAEQVGGRIAVQPEDRGPNFFDVSGDRFISALDALQVVNELNRRDSDLLEGEQVGAILSSDDDAVSEDTVDEAAAVAAEGEKVIDATTPVVVDSNIVSLIAEDRYDDDEDDVASTLDAALLELV